LCEFADEIAFERLGVFTYSPQEGTRATDYPDDVPEELKISRQEELLELQRAISSDRLGRYVGRETTALMDGPAVGRVPWQADDVDGVTYVEGAPRARPGDLLLVRIQAGEDVDFHARALL
jgi:ribosomal protein S12 methylthiotransferase